MYGHARRDRNGGLWLQYWLFYYYNDFQLLGSLFSGGKHEGDWELVQLRLDAKERPVLAVFSQHKEAERRPWTKVAKQRRRARSSTSRAARTPTTSAPGSHWTGHWFDRADGKGPQDRPRARDRRRPTPRSGCSGPAAGATRKAEGPLDSNSPTSPGVRPHWKDPLALIQKATPTKPAPAPPPPKTTVVHTRRHARRRRSRPRRRRRRSSSPPARAAATSPPRRTRSRSTRPPARSKSPPRARTTRSGQVLWLRGQAPSQSA